MHSTPSWRTCPCAPCRTRTRAYKRNLMREHRANPGPRLIPAEPIAQHLEKLRDSGWSLRALERASGYDRSTILRIRERRSTQIRTVLAEDFLSIPERAA